MANAQITTKSGNIIEVAIEDILHWFSKVEQVVLKGPHIIMAIGTLLAAVEKVLADVQIDVANPIGLINISVDAQQLADVKVIWPDIKAVFTAAGIKF